MRSERGTRKRVAVSGVADAARPEGFALQGHGAELLGGRRAPCTQPGCTQGALWLVRPQGLQLGEHTKSLQLHSRHRAKHRDQQPDVEMSLPVPSLRSLPTPTSP